MNDYYRLGFEKRCADLGVHPQALVKYAQRRELSELRAMGRSGLSLTAFDGKGSPYPINNVLSDAEIKQRIKWYGERLQGVRPIAEDHGGNVFGTRGKEVVNWDHEEADPKKQITLISPSLKEFIASVKRRKDDGLDSELEPPVGVEYPGLAGARRGALAGAAAGGIPMALLGALAMRYGNPGAKSTALGAGLGGGLGALYGGALGAHLGSSPRYTFND